MKPQKLLIVLSIVLLISSCGSENTDKTQNKKTNPKEEKEENSKPQK